MLRPPGSPPLPEEYLARIEASRPMLYQHARENYGLELNPGPFKQNSRPALILEKYAQEQGKGAEYHQLVENAFWQEAQSIDDLDTLRKIMDTLGFDSSKLETILEDKQYIEAVDRDYYTAVQSGINGVPAVVFDEKYLVSGAQPYEVFTQVIERIQEMQSE